MTVDRSYFVDVIGFGSLVDIMPKVREAMAKCQYRHDLTELEVAELVEKSVHGKYIPVATQDRVANRMLGELTRPVIQWVQSEYRIAQLIDSELQTMRPYIEILTGPNVCDAVKPMCGRWLTHRELVRLPLPECDTGPCHCQYLTQSRRDVEQRGVQPRGLG